MHSSGKWKDEGCKVSEPLGKEECNRSKFIWHDLQKKCSYLEPNLSARFETALRESLIQIFFFKAYCIHSNEQESFRLSISGDKMP